MLSKTPVLQLLSHDVVAEAAYYHWLKAGQPSGRDHEFWLQAEGQLRNTVASPGVPSPEPRPAGDGRVVGTPKVSGRKKRQRLTSAN